MPIITPPQPAPAPLVYQGSEKTRLADIAVGDWVCYEPSSHFFDNGPRSALVTKVTATQITLENGERFLIRSGNLVHRSGGMATIHALGDMLPWGQPITYDAWLDHVAAEKVQRDYRDGLIRQIVKALPTRWQHITDIGRLERILAALTSDSPDEAIGEMTGHHAEDGV